MKNKLARIGLISSTLFIILLTALHFIEPEFDPSIHLISDYELGQYGWIMSIAFFSLGFGVLSMVISTWSYIKNRRGMIGRWWFLIIFIALMGASVFYPYTTPNIASKIHTICGLIVVFSFPIATSLYSSGLANSQELKDSKKWLRLMSLFVWFGLLLFVGSIIFFHPADAKDKANLVVGWQNRFMMLTYCLWLIALNYKYTIHFQSDIILEDKVINNWRYNHDKIEPDL